MNICIISHRYPYKGNMVHVFIKKLVDEWAKMGHTCVVIAPLSIVHLMIGKEKGAPKKQTTSVNNGRSVVVYRPRYYTIPKLKLFGISINANTEQRCIEKTIKKTGIEFDVIYCHFFSMAVVAWHYANENHIPLFVATGESFIGRLNKPCFSFSIEKMRKTICGVVAVSNKNKNEAVNLGYANATDAQVFPNGTNLRVFKKLNKVECRKKMHLPLDLFIVICVGQFVERKGQKRLLEAIDVLNYDKIGTIFIGKGDDTLEHKSIVYKGTVENDLLPYYLNAADVFVLPTLNEGCCNSIVEALACGLPIISSDKPFNHDILNADNSLLVDPNDINCISKAIEKLYVDNRLRSFLASKSHETGQNLSIEKRAERIINFFNEKTCKKTW